MRQVPEFPDERHKAWCIHCGASIDEAQTNRDHVPSKCFLQKPYPDNLPVVEVCERCNEGFSLDEEYLVAFLGAVLSGSTAPDAQTISSASRILLNNTALRDRIERSKSAYSQLDGTERLVWLVESERAKNVILKNARGHAFYEMGEPMLDAPSCVQFTPLETLTSHQRDASERDEAVLAPWPEVGSRMMTRVLSGEDMQDGWIVVQNGVYRYRVEQVGTMRVKTVLFEYLATEVSWD